jgi:hypothetical protein
MCLWAGYKKKNENIFFASLKSMKKGVGSISQRYGSGDPDPHQNVTDPQHCKKVFQLIELIYEQGIRVLFARRNMIRKYSFLNINEH